MRTREDINTLAIDSQRIDSPELAPVEKSERIEQVITWAEEQLSWLEPAAKKVLEARFASLPPNDTAFDPSMSIEDQLYGDPTYDADIVKQGLDLRKRATLGFHEITTSYNDKIDDSLEAKEKKEHIRTALLEIGQEFGFVPIAPSDASDPSDRWLDMQNSELEPILGKVDAVVIPGAAGKSNHMRLADTIRDIEAGIIDTDHIIFATCSRKVRPDEIKNLTEAGFTTGTNNFGISEYNLCEAACEDLLGVSFDAMGYAAYKVENPQRIDHSSFRKTTAVIGGKMVEIHVVQTSQDGRLDARGFEPDRADTRDTFYGLAGLLPEDAERIVIKSHDTWVNYQDVIAREVFELGMDIDVISSGPRRSDRVFYKKDEHGRILTDSEGEPIMDLNNAEQVMDEIAKTYQDIMKLRSKAISYREKFALAA